MRSVVRVHLSPFARFLKNRPVHGHAFIGVPGLNRYLLRGCSSAGRAPALQAGGQGFEPPHLHFSFFENSVVGHNVNKVNVSNFNCSAILVIFRERMKLWTTWIACSPKITGPVFGLPIASQ